MLITILAIISNVVMACVNSRIYPEGNKNLNFSCFEMTESVINWSSLILIVIFWDKETSRAKYEENSGNHVINAWDNFT